MYSDADSNVGEVKYWNDPVILKDQEDDPVIHEILKNVNKPIRLILRSDGAGTTDDWTDAMSSFSADWKAKLGAFSDWPESMFDANGTNAVRAPGSDAMVILTKVTPYALGYDTWSAVNRSTSQWGFLETRSGLPSSPLDLDHIENAMDSVVFTDKYVHFLAHLSVCPDDCSGLKAPSLIPLPRTVTRSLASATSSFSVTRPPTPTAARPSTATVAASSGSSSTSCSTTRT